MKFQNKKKAFVLSMTLAAMMMTGSLSAQEREGSLFGGLKGLFGTATETEEEVTPESEALFAGGNRDGSGNASGGFNLGGLDEDDPTNPNGSPLGSGLLILTATGVGYALLKKKEEEK